MGVGVYGTAAEIWTSALEAMPRGDQGQWPDSDERLRIINSGMRAAQRRCGAFKVLLTHSFADGEKYYEITGVDPKIFKLTSAFISGKEMDIVAHKTLLAYRQENAAFTTTKVYIFSLNITPGSTLGTIRIEMYPAADGAVSVDFVIESIPTQITASSDTVYVPRDIIEAYVKWVASQTLAPEKAGYFRTEFETLCNEDVSIGAVSKRPTYATTFGFIQTMANKFK